MKISISILFIILSLFQILMAEERKWSGNQGKLKWSDAKSKCAKLGMRLPSVEELKANYENNNIDSWKKDGNVYWTSKELSADRAYYFTLLNGTTFSLFKNRTVSVRCVL